ncbi:Sensor histidine kinase RcsC [Neolewinella maritima]|uniref:histidine kinase n=1 Tax=Neolewinella maritima TaxID=1383882 RepID=A0ABN8FBH0_9BACT|nr:ATP-binding protein [Neolewinella maritima]CAH1001843.1 Sensor histidine kinase RcsC [Neolewinella maritima]
MRIGQLAVLLLLFVAPLPGQGFGTHLLDSDVPTPLPAAPVYDAATTILREYPPLEARLRAIPAPRYYATVRGVRDSIGYVARRWTTLARGVAAGTVPSPDSTYWFRLQLAGGPFFAGPQLINVAPAPLDELYSFAYIDAFEADGAGGWMQRRAGRDVPVGERSIHSWINLLPVTGRPGDTSEVFVRLEGANTVFQPQAMRFWHVKPLPLLEVQGQRAFLDGIFYGLVGLQFIFFTLLFLVERESIYGWFAVLCLGIFLFTAFSIIIDEYYAPFPWWDRWHLFLASIGFSVAHTGFLCFTMTYFKIPFSTRPWNWVIPLLLTVSWLDNLCTGLFKTSINWFDPFFRSLEMLDNALGILVCLLSAWMVISSPARPGASKPLYLVALSPIIFMAAYYLGQDLIIGLGGQELVHDENLDSLGWFKASALTMLMLLSLGIGQRNNRLKQERFNAQEELIENLRQTDQLQELDQLKTRFYTNITHEFRTPLTVILGLAGRPEARGAAELIRRNGRKLLDLVNQLLDLSRLTAGSITPAYRDLDLVAYTQYLGESYQTLATDRGITLTIYSEEPELTFRTDPERYRQIVSNLLTNAIKFTPAGGKVILHLSLRDERLELRVSDTGTGIAERELDRIFDHFYQTNHSGSREGEGTGVGLALVREVVTLLGGEISVRSTLGKGSVFTVRLPRYTGPVASTADRPDHFAQFDDAREVTPALPIIAQRASSRGTRKLPQLLLIEDNPDVVSYLSILLQDRYRLLVATDGGEGTRLATEAIPDVIISDVMMPVKDGFTVVEELKSDERTSHIPILLLTARAAQEDRLQGLRYGVDAYLPKPFDERELLLQLANLVATRRKLQKRYRNFVPAPAPAADMTPDERFLHRLDELLESHYRESAYGVKDYAAGLTISHTQYYRKLKALTGHTPSRYLSRYRLRKGKLLLADPDLHVSEVAYRVGFKDPNYFTRMFSEFFGQSPNAYRMGLTD